MLNNNRLIIISGIAILFILLIMDYFLNSKNPSNTPSTKTVISPAENQFDYPKDSSDTTNDIVLEIENNSNKVNTQGDRLILNNARYQVLYEPKFNQILITILASPFEIVRKEAEDELLRALGTNKADLCKFSVSVSTPRFANPDEAGKVYNLSFCN